MNVLILADIETAGEWIATQNMLEELKKRKQSLNFYLLAYGKNTLHLQKQLFEKIILINKPPLIPLFRYYRQLLLEYVQNFKYIKVFKNRIDLIIITNYSFSIPAFLIFPFVKRVFWFHGIKELNNFNFYGRVKIILERFSWLFISIFLVPSEWAKDLVKKKLGLFSQLKNIKIIANIVPVIFQQKYSQPTLVNFKKKLYLPQDKKIILYSGRIDKIKGLENLLTAFVLLHKKLDGIVLVFAYPDVYLDSLTLKNLQKTVKINRLENSVFFRKNLPVEELAKLYQSSYCAVLASIREMDSMFLLESLSSGLPVFSTLVGNAEILLAKIDTLFILKNNQALTIFQALAKFFKKDSSWYKNIKKKIENFVIEYLANNYSVSQFEKILG